MHRARTGNLRGLVGVALLAFGVAAPAGAQFVTYHGTGGGEGGPCEDPTGPPLSVAVGAPGSVNLCFVNDDVEGSFSDPALVCDTGTGSEVCSVLVTATAMGMTIDGFVPSGVADESSISGDTLTVIASNASGFSGRTLLGTIQVTGTAAGGMLEAVSEWYGASLAAGETTEDAVVLASIGGFCGDGTVNTPPEDCEDGNTAAGDGCLACRNELVARVSGTAQGGTITFDFGEGEAPGPVASVTTQPGESAALTVDRLVSGVNAVAAVGAAGITFQESAFSSQTVGTTRDAEVTNTDPGLQVIPEPGVWLQLGSCLGALASLAWLRRRSAGRRGR